MIFQLYFVYWNTTQNENFKTFQNIPKSQFQNHKKKMFYFLVKCRIKVALVYLPKIQKKIKSV